MRHEWNRWALFGGPIVGVGVNYLGVGLGFGGCVGMDFRFSGHWFMSLRGLRAVGGNGYGDAGTADYVGVGIGYGW